MPKNRSERLKAMAAEQDHRDDALARAVAERKVGRRIVTGKDIAAEYAALGDLDTGPRDAPDDPDIGD